MAGLTEEITFRLSAEHFGALKAAAKDAGLKSANLMARRILRDALNGEAERQEILLRIQELDALLKKMRGDIATSTHVLLMAANHPDSTTTASDVADWVAKNLRAP